jgi:hypothetical protein
MPFTAGLGSYVIVWLRDGVELARESCGLRNAEEVVRYARAKVLRGAANADGEHPTEFRLSDETGHEIGRYPAAH